MSEGTSLMEADEVSGEASGIRSAHIPKGVFAIAKIADAEMGGAYGAVEVTRTNAGRMQAAATDGRIAIRLSWQDEYILPNDEVECLVPAEIALLAEKAIPKEGLPDHTHAMVTIDSDDAVELRVIRPTDAIKFEGTLIDEKMPDVNGVIPLYSAIEAHRSTLGVDRLIQLLQTMKAVGGDEVTIMVPADDARPVRFYSHAHEHSIHIDAVQMPLHRDARQAFQSKAEKAAEERAVLPGLETPVAAVIRGVAAAAGVEVTTYPDGGLNATMAGEQVVAALEKVRGYAVVSAASEDINSKDIESARIPNLAAQIAKKRYATIDNRILNLRGFLYVPTVPLAGEKGYDHLLVPLCNLSDEVAPESNPYSGHEVRGEDGKSLYRLGPSSEFLRVKV